MTTEIQTIATSGVIPSDVGCLQLIDQRKNLALALKQEGAKSQAAAAAPAMIEVFATAKNDPILSGLDWNADPYSIVYKIATGNNILHRMAIGKYLTPGACAYFPLVEKYLKDTNATSAVVNFLQDRIRETAAHFGVAVAGQEAVIAYGIISNYGGLTIADFVLFFERLKMGYYKNEHQHIAVRGINADFLNGWLAAYVEERTADVQANYDTYKEPTGANKDFDISAYIAQRQQERKRKEAELQILESDAETMRTEWLANIQTVEMTIEEVPVKVWTKYGVESELKRLASEFLFEHAPAYIEKMKQQHGNNFDFVAKRIIYEIGQFVDNVNPFDLYMVFLRSYCQQRGIPFEGNPAKYIREAIDGYEQQYRDHLKMRIDEKSIYPPLTKKWYVVKCVLYAYSSIGIELPTKQIFYQQ